MASHSRSPGSQIASNDYPSLRACADACNALDVSSSSPLWHIHSRSAHKHPTNDTFSSLVAFRHLHADSAAFTSVGAAGGSYACYLKTREAAPASTLSASNAYYNTAIMGPCEAQAEQASPYAEGQCVDIQGASVVASRRQRMLARRAKLESNNLHPCGDAALLRCPISGRSGAYECMDPSVDIEACGGCGRDCAELLPGSVFAGCEQGRCAACALLSYCGDMADSACSVVQARLSGATGRLRPGAGKEGNSSSCARSSRHRSLAFISFRLSMTVVVYLAVLVCEMRAGPQACDGVHFRLRF